METLTIFETFKPLNINNMKRILIFIATTVFFTSCNRKFYQYNVVLKEPTKSENLTFTDSIIDIKFQVNQNNIGFTLKNKSQASIKLLWDDAAFVLFGKASPVYNKSTKVIHSALSKPNTTIPSEAFISDIFAPLDESIGFFDTYNRNTSIFPFFTVGKYDSKLDYIKKLKGTDFTVFMPIAHKNEILEYYFVFNVVSIMTGGQSNIIETPDREPSKNKKVAKKKK